MTPQDSVRAAARNRAQQNNVPQPALPPHMRNQQQQQQRNAMMSNQQQIPQQQQMLMQSAQGQQILDHHDENLSDKEIYPGAMHGQMVNITHVFLLHIFFIILLAENAIVRPCLLETAGPRKSLFRKIKIDYYIFLDKRKIYENAIIFRSTTCNKCKSSSFSFYCKCAREEFIYFVVHFKRIKFMLR